MKVLATSIRNIYNCQGCGALLQYEDEDIQYETYTGIGNTNLSGTQYVSYVECPICHSHLEFYNFTKLNNDEDKRLVHFTNKYYGKEYSEVIHKV